MPRGSARGAWTATSGGRAYPSWVGAGRPQARPIERRVILVSSSAAKIASCLDSRIWRWSRELRAPPAVPQAVTGWVYRSRCRRGRNARPLAREHRGDVYRRCSGAARDRSRPPCAALARARRPQPGRGPVGGRGAARARAARGGGLAAAPLAAVGGRGDIDSVAIAPTGVAFAIETKTKTIEHRHLARVLKQAEWLSRRRRRWCMRGAKPVVCLARRRGVEHVEGRSAGGVGRAACRGSAWVRQPVRSSGLLAVRSPGCPGRGDASTLVAPWIPRLTWYFDT